MDSLHQGTEKSPAPGQWSFLPRAIAFWLPMACLVALAVPCLVHAQSSEKKAVTAQLAMMKVVAGPEGVERLVEAGAVKPGDVVEYRVTYTNVSAHPVTRLVAALPVPAGMDYVPNSAQMPGIVTEAATADGHFAREPLVRQMKKSDGSALGMAVPYPEYRALHWQLGLLPPHASAVVTARMRVEESAAAAPASADAAPSAL